MSSDADFARRTSPRRGAATAAGALAILLVAGGCERTSAPSAAVRTTPATPPVAADLSTPAAAAPAGATGAATAARPNVLVVCIDALRADRLGAYGASPSPSPSLDALASDGIVFTNATSVASWTKPSVPSLLTGLYPDEHGVFDNSRSHVDSLGPDVPTLAATLQQQGWRTGAFVENDQLVRRLSGLDRGFSTWVDEAGRAPDLADRFLNWSELGGPWFAYLHFFDAHFPYAPDELLFDEQEAGRLRVRLAHWDLQSEFWWLLRDRVNTKAMRLDESALTDLDRLYRLEIRQVDAVIGRLLGALDRAGALERTLVVVTADHGEGFLERGRIDHGYGPYRELANVPMLVRLPWRAQAGRRSEALVQTLDVPATVVDVLDLPSSAPSSSRSLLAAVEDPSSARAAAFAQERHGRSEQLSVRDARYSYVRSLTTPVDGRAAAVAPASAAPGVRVRAQGIFDGERLVAGTVKRLAPGDPDVEIGGPVERVDAASSSFRVLGTSVSFGRPVEDGRDGTVSLADLAVGQHVRVHGEVEAGVFRPTKIELLDRRPIEVEGVIRSIAAAGSDLLLDVGGASFVVDPKARWSDFPDEPVRPADSHEARAPVLVEELFDRQQDPAELRDVAASSPTELARLREAADRIRAELRPAAGRNDVDLDDEARERLRALGYVE